MDPSDLCVALGVAMRWALLSDLSLQSPWNGVLGEGRSAARRSCRESGSLPTTSLPRESGQKQLPGERIFWDHVIPSSASTLSQRYGVNHRPIIRANKSPH